MTKTMVNLVLLDGMSDHVRIGNKMFKSFSKTTINADFTPVGRGNLLIKRYRHEVYYPYGRREMIPGHNLTKLYYDELALYDALA